MRGESAFIGGARAAGRIEGSEQANGRSFGILHAVAHSYREENAGAGLEFTRFSLDMNHAAAGQNEDAFLVHMSMRNGFARWNPPDELSDLPAAEIGVDQIAKLPVAARQNDFSVLFADRPPRGGARPGGARSVHDAAPGVFRTAGMNHAQRRS